MPHKLPRFAPRNGGSAELCGLANPVNVHPDLPPIRALRTAWGSPDRRTDEAPTSRSTPISSEAVERREQARTRTKAWFTNQEDTA